MKCFVNRIGTHPERLQNVYFAYALLLRAVNKVGPYLEHYEFRTGSLKEDEKTSYLVQDLIKSTTSCPPTFDEKSMFRGSEAHVKKRIWIESYFINHIIYRCFDKNLRSISEMYLKLWTVSDVKNVDFGVNFKQ